jgi:DNA-3-methyladenine glycosylase II
VQLKGFGRWTSEVYLMFALGRPDIWPADDLAVQVAVHKINRLDTRPNRKAMDAIAEQWRPWRSVAAILMWHHYRNAP